MTNGYERFGRSGKSGSGQVGFGMVWQERLGTSWYRQVGVRKGASWYGRRGALGLGLVMYGKAGGVRCVQVRNGVGLSRLERSLYGR